MALDYTVDEIKEKIKELDDEIRTLRRRPSSQSLDGNFVSFAGQLSAAMKDRDYWRRCLALALKGERGQNGMQGPDFEV